MSIQVSQCEVQIIIIMNKNSYFVYIIHLNLLKSNREFNVFLVKL